MLCGCMWLGVCDCVCACLGCVMLCACVWLGVCDVVCMCVVRGVCS